MEPPINYTASRTSSPPSTGYELSFGISLAKVGRDGCKGFICERIVSNLMYYYYYFLIINNQGKQKKC